MTPGSEIVVQVVLALAVKGSWPQRIREPLHRFHVKRVKGDTITAIGHFGGQPHRLLLSMQDRGVTWAPAWRESERRAFESACALRGEL